MFSTKEQLNSFIKKVYRRLDHNHFMIKLIRSKELAGQCYPTANWIELNPSQDIVPTLMHEMLHDIYPDWSEKKVLANERLIMTKLSHKRIITILKKLSASLDKNYRELKGL